MFNMLSEAMKKGWEVEAVTKDGLDDNTYHVLVKRSNAPLKERPYSIHTWSKNGFHSGHYDYTEDEAYEDYKAQNW